MKYKNSTLYKDNVTWNIIKKSCLYMHIVFELLSKIFDTFTYKTTKSTL